MTRGTTVFEAAWFGVVPGATDVSTQLNNAISVSASSGAALHVGPGRYELSGPVKMLSLARVFGDGASTVFSATVPSSGRLWPVGAALVEFKNVHDAALCDLTLDHRGIDRDTSDRTLDFTMLMTNASANLVSGVTFLNAGSVAPGASPSGPSLLMLVRQPRCKGGCVADIACDAGDEGYFGDAGQFDPSVPGNVESNRISGCAWIQDERLDTGFAVRMHSNFMCKRTPSAFVYRVQGNLLEKSSFKTVSADGGEGDGGFFWNTVELAGGGTTSNSIRGNQFAGRTLTHVDFDKGVSNNLAEGNVILWSALPRAGLVGTALIAPLADHGSDADYLNRDNTLRNNTVFAVRSAERLPLHASGGIYLQNTRGSVVVGNTINSFLDGLALSPGGALVLHSNVQNATIRANTLGAVTNTSPWPVGIGLDAIGSDIASIDFSENTIAANNTAVSIGVPTCSAATTSDWYVASNVVRNREVIGGSAPLLVLANAAYVTSNWVEGGDWGLIVGRNAHVYNNATNAPRGIELYGAADVAGNSASDCRITCDGGTITYSGTNTFPSCH